MDEWLEILRGPIMWVAVAICIGGLAYQLSRLIRATTNRKSGKIPASSQRSPTSLTRDDTFIARLKHGYYMWQVSPVGRQKRVLVTTGVFHLCLFIAPLFAQGHALWFREAFGVAPWSFSAFWTEVCTLAALLCLGALFLRRLTVSAIRMLSGATDYLLLVITAMPFVTGILAFHQIGPYKPMLLAHVISGQLLLIFLGMTKLSHMTLYVFARFFVASTRFRGNRRWA